MKTGVKFRLARADANHLLDWLKAEYGFTSDAKMAKALKINFTYLSKYRNGKEILGPTCLICIHVFTGLPILRLIEISEDH